MLSIRSKVYFILLIYCTILLLVTFSLNFYFSADFGLIIVISNTILFTSLLLLDVGLLLVMIWLELYTTYSSSSPVVTTTSIILCFNKHRLTQVHLENGRWNGERDSLYVVGVWWASNNNNNCCENHKSHLAEEILHFGQWFGMQ